MPESLWGRRNHFHDYLIRVETGISRGYPEQLDGLVNGEVSERAHRYLGIRFVDQENVGASIYTNAGIASHSRQPEAPVGFDQRLNYHTANLFIV
ncbi:MAG: hypothetical protein WBM45_03970, partial [Woeseiaceae bacterium]